MKLQEQYDVTEQKLFESDGVYHIQMRDIEEVECEVSLEGDFTASDLSEIVAKMRQLEALQTAIDATNAEGSL